MGATRLIALTGANWPRWYERCGLRAEALGRGLWIDGEAFQCVSINLTVKMN